MSNVSCKESIRGDSRVWTKIFYYIGVVLKRLNAEAKCYCIDFNKSLDYNKLSNTIIICFMFFLINLH